MQKASEADDVSLGCASAFILKEKRRNYGLLKRS